MHRQFLTIATFALVAICYAVAAPGPLTSPATSPTSRPAIPYRTAYDPGYLFDACRAVADDLHQRLPNGWSVAVRGLFVLGGDYDEQLLDQYYRQTIQPTARALSVQYFDHSPTWPVTILLCSSDESYRECHRRLDERERSEYSGIYSRTEHRIVVNVGTGEGTLAHELTHALAHADFPALPEWLDEGLASLHEECEFSSGGLRLIGLDNWRLSEIREAKQRSQLRSVSDLASERFATADRASIDYAHARYFCLFLQQRQLLEPLYRKCRSRVETDPTGVISLCELFAMQDCREIDEQFRVWLSLIPKAGDTNQHRR